MSVWHEIIVVGGEGPVRGFVAGFLGGRAQDEAVLFGHDVRVQAATLGGRLLELVGAGSHHALLTPAAVAGPLSAALRRTGADADLRHGGESVVVAASFAFTAEAFSREVAATVESALREAVPAGVTVEAFKEEETIDQGARGAELYAPKHAYVYRAKGRIGGDLPGVLEMRRRAEQIEFVKADGITLERRALPPAPDR